MSKLSSIRSAAQRADCPVSHDALRRLVATGQIPSIPVGNRRLIDPDYAFAAIRARASGKEAQGDD